MGCSGYIDWHRLERTTTWVRDRLGGQHTYVVAFWTVDYGHPANDYGLKVVKHENTHPDWFLHADTADSLLAAFPRPSAAVSPNYRQVFDDTLLSNRPLLASVTLGTCDAVYRRPDAHLWWACADDLTRAGRRLLKHLNKLYERPATLITFIDQPTDENSGSRDPS